MKAPGIILKSLLDFLIQLVKRSVELGSRIIEMREGRLNLNSYLAVFCSKHYILVKVGFKTLIVFYSWGYVGVFVCLKCGF